MIKTNTRTKIKKCETAVLWFLLLVTIAVTGLYFGYKQSYLAFYIGYTAGTLGFIALSLTFSYIDKLPGWFKIVAIMSTSFKILFLFALTLILKLLGFSVIQVVVGLLSSQLVIVLSLVLIIYTSREPAENKIGKEKSTDAFS